METDNFSFDLPEELIAQSPADRREDARLMHLHMQAGGRISHHRVADLPQLLPRDALMVINDSKVRKARIYGETEHGGEVEFLLLEQIERGEWKAVASKARRQRRGRRYRFPGTVEGSPVYGEITGAEGGHRYLRFDPPIDEAYLEEHGHVPLPPYIRRPETEEDEQRYQTVYARTTGSVAAPTAGLHLTEELLAELRERGVEIARLTLHVGIGTFSPIRTDRVEEHRMHSERYTVPERTAEVVTRAKRTGRPVYAVGTTSVRTLESAWDSGRGALPAGDGETDLFIYPGHRFRVVDGLLTNFHTPRSSLLVLVSAFAGKGLIDTAYRTAVEKRYRFFSYGDAMLIHSRTV